MRLAWGVSGYRGDKHMGLSEEAQRQIRYYADFYREHRRPDLIVHGDAKGVDTFFEQYAQQHGIQTLVMPARWDDYGKSAGIIRNNAMVNVLGALEKAMWDIFTMAFPSPDSIGTRDFINRCVHRKVICRVHEISG